MIAELPLASLLSIIWTIVFVMAVFAVSYWASRLTTAQSEIIAILSRSKRAPRSVLVRENRNASSAPPASQRVR